MKQYNVTGMSCAACSARVEKAVSGVRGVTACSVSLLTNSMGVEGSADDKAIIEAVKKAGYGASLKGAEKTQSDDDSLKDRETPVLKRRLLWSLGFLLVLMYFSMGRMMLGLPVPEFFETNHAAMGLLQMILAAIVMIINQKFFVNGFKGALHLSPNMDTLVAMGSGASFIYSVFALFLLIDAEHKGVPNDYMHEFYFESAAMILVLITVGKMLEARSKGKTTDALKSLMKLAPKTAVLEINGEEKQVPAEQVKPGDIFIVRTGENIPVDGVVSEGTAAIDEAALTGESIPVDKQPGDNVSAATLNRSGYIKCRAVRVGKNTALSQIIKMVSDAAATKAPIAKIADKVSGIFVPTVIAIAVLTTSAWLILGKAFGWALARGISVLVISCPCALGLATPVAIMAGSGVGARNGILFKTAASLEAMGKTQTAVLDKTGTVTMGEPKVTGIYPADDISSTELLTLACSIEKKSGHPLARAIVIKAEEEKIVPIEVNDFEEKGGKGLSAVCEGFKITAGNLNAVSRIAEIPKSAQENAEKLSSDGKTALFFCKNDRFLGIIAVADVIKPESPEAVRQLKNMGIKVVMLTGDNRRTAEAIGAQAGVDEVIAEVLPDGKEQVIRRLKAGGRTAMVGDGINDAPALTSADTGIAIGAGTDVAIDAADVVLMKSRLTDVPAAIRLSRGVVRNIKQNLFWAFFYNIIGIPLAAGVWIPVFGWQLSPAFGAAAMSMSSFCVVTNALRLNFLKLHDPDKDKKIKQKKTEVKTMETTLKIEGMMCGHCEASVKKALEAVQGVSAAEVSHEKGTAVVTHDDSVSYDALKGAVEAKDYKVTG